MHVYNIYTCIYIYIYTRNTGTCKHIQDCCAHSTALKIRCSKKFGSSYLIFSNFEFPLV